ncbi:MAG: hypothetical protein F9K29_13900 [Hyphomicrobiaceae bacterium]|nr:MAG: hypothetical protein F9K29_13900 [Hyphomicrobiaceae bacterium]
MRRPLAAFGCGLAFVILAALGSTPAPALTVGALKSEAKAHADASVLTVRCRGRGCGWCCRSPHDRAPMVGAYNSYSPYLRRAGPVIAYHAPRVYYVPVPVPVPVYVPVYPRYYAAPVYYDAYAYRAWSGRYYNEGW